METETKYNVYGNESSPKLTYKYVDGYWQKQYKIYDYLGSLRYTISQMNTVLNYKAYDPYGNELIDTMKQTRQGYIGKENDVENGLGDHGVRKYDPGTGRFNSGEPLSDKFPGISPYVYCFNNPIRLIDWNGFGPGDPFNTAKEAVIDFAINFNAESILTNTEIGTRLYSYRNSDGEKKFSYTNVARGTEGLVTPPETPENTTSEGTAHTHAAWDPKLKNRTNMQGDKDMNDHLTDGDTYNDKYSFKGPVWGVFPNGKIEMWDPHSKKDPNLIVPIKTGTYLPCDVNDPNRGKNNNTVNDLDTQIEFLQTQVPKY